MHMHESTRYDVLIFALVGVLVAGFVLVYLVNALRYVCASAEQRAVMRTALRIKRTWRHTAQRVGLSMTERARRLDGSDAGSRVLIPSISARGQAWGVLVGAHTVGRIGLEQFENAADHLADAWRVHRVSVEQREPGRLRLRAVLRDPLIEPRAWCAPANGAPVDPGAWPLGVDADEMEVVLRSANVSGAVVAGLAGYGKTSLLDARFCQLATHPCVQMAVIDGKGGPDWEDQADRLFAYSKDGPDKARDILTRVHTLMCLRQAWIGRYLKVKNFWERPFSADWPLVVVVIDEAHTFFYETKGSDADSKRRDALARETVRLVEELVRKGRNVGIQVILATQKATGDAIPTRIRDNCQVAISFAQRTSEAAIAALGSDIGSFPDAHPRRLQDAKYVGVASVVAEGRAGFTLVRTPLVPPGAAMELARETAELRMDPLEAFEEILARKYRGVLPLDVAAALVESGAGA